VIDTESKERNNHQRRTMVGTTLRVNDRSSLVRRLSPTSHRESEGAFRPCAHLAVPVAAA
jgi:hypothetical protein